MGMEIVRETSPAWRHGDISPRPAAARYHPAGAAQHAVVHVLIVRDHGRLLAIPASQVASVHCCAGLDRRAQRPPASTISAGDVPLYRLPPAPSRAAKPHPRRDQRLSGALSRRPRGVGARRDGERGRLIVKPLRPEQGWSNCWGHRVRTAPRPRYSTPPLLIGAGGRAAIWSHRRRSPSISGLVVDDSLTMRIALTIPLSTPDSCGSPLADGQEALEVIRTRGLPT